MPNDWHDHGAVCAAAVRVSVAVLLNVSLSVSLGATAEGMRALGWVRVEDTATRCRHEGARMTKLRQRVSEVALRWPYGRACATSCASRPSIFVVMNRDHNNFSFM